MFYKLTLVFLFLFGSIGFANPEPKITLEETPIENFSEEFGVENYEKNLIKVFSLLVLLITFLGFSIWFMKRFFNRKMLSNSVGKSIHILEKRMLSPKSILYVVEVNGKRVLISESQLEIRKLETIEIIEDKN